VTAVTPERTRGPASPFGDAEAEAVTIGDDWCRLRLRPASTPFEGAYPTLIEVRAGPFVGTVLDEEVVGFWNFRDELAQIHTSLVGEAILRSLSGSSLVLTGNGRGAIAVSAEIVAATAANMTPSIQLSAKFELDQTYLPAIIASLDRDFLAGDGSQALE
jgi:hypothetical protein